MLYVLWRKGCDFIMLRINSVTTLGFVGEADGLIRQLTCPLCSKESRDCFCYKSSLYRIAQPDDSAVRVVVFSATDTFCCFDALCRLVRGQRAVLYITDVKRARRMGIKINRQALSYSLGCPVIFATRGTRGLNRLLGAIHLVSNTPSSSAGSYAIKKSVITLKVNFVSKFKEFLTSGKNVLLKCK